MFDTKDVRCLIGLLTVCSLLLLSGCYPAKIRKQHYDEEVKFLQSQGCKVPSNIDLTFKTKYIYKCNGKYITSYVTPKDLILAGD